MKDRGIKFNMALHKRWGPIKSKKTGYQGWLHDHLGQVNHLIRGIRRGGNAQDQDRGNDHQGHSPCGWDGSPVVSVDF